MKRADLLRQGIIDKPQAKGDCSPLPPWGEKKKKRKKKKKEKKKNKKKDWDNSGQRNRKATYMYMILKHVCIKSHLLHVSD